MKLTDEEKLALVVTTPIAVLTIAWALISELIKY
ncbi:hypothetical protein ABMB67_003170 [Halalkalibacter oceani]